MAPSAMMKDLKRKRTQEDGADEVAEKTPVYKQRVLAISSRGISQRQRHLMADLISLLPHAKKDAKLEDKHSLPSLNEIAYLSSCNNILFFEARRQHGDLYLWAAKAPNGPSCRFHVLNAHTMDEMKMTGNCLKGSRPIVVFDQQFDESPHMKLIKEVLTHIFAVPKTARRAKPFVDHVINFSIADGKIWFRNYQIIDTPPADAMAATSSSSRAITEAQAKKLAQKEGAAHLSLSEVGPRFVLNPVKIFEGSFNGACIYENKEFVPSSALSSGRKFERAKKYKARKGQQEERKVRLEEIMPGHRDDPLEKRKVFA
ncbi:ribosome biogenesis protein BRX1 [Sporobolomyces koalae]|uniref:ribosome biogenesis protein BRX1 n=1 Tax=Sporobolomyces koalae TaxID=500713 RepID=UPI003179D442